MVMSGDETLVGIALAIAIIVFFLITIAISPPIGIFILVWFVWWVLSLDQCNSAEISLKPADQATIIQPTDLTNRQGQTTAQLLVKQAGLKIISSRSGDLQLSTTATILFEAGPLDQIQLQAQPKRVKPKAAATIKF